MSSLIEIPDDRRRTGSCAKGAPITYLKLADLRFASDFGADDALALARCRARPASSMPHFAILSPFSRCLSPVFKDYYARRAKYHLYLPPSSGFSAAAGESQLHNKCRPHLSPYTDISASRCHARHDNNTLVSRYSDLMAWLRYGLAIIDWRLPLRASLSPPPPESPRRRALTCAMPTGV